MNTNLNRKEALEWAEAGGDSNTLAVVHGLVYVGDMLADLVTAHGSNTATTPPPSPKLQALLAKASPPSVATAEVNTVNGEQNGHAYPLDSARFKPRHDPADWKKLPDGRWLSPSGRRYHAWTRQAFGVITARRKLGLPI
jgi:hypothetical protein